jgi:Ca-activated chloride channel family protein
MEENDKDNLRIAAAKSFIDRLNPNIDKIGFITWAGELLDENKSIQGNRTKVIVFLSDGIGDYTNSADPESITKSAAVRGYKIYSIGLNVNYNREAENDLRDIARATNGVYYSSPIAENLNDIYSKIFQNIITKGSPKQIDLLVTLPKEELKVNDFSIEPSNIDLENKKVIWKNISQHVGNKDNALRRIVKRIASFSGNIAVFYGIYADLI